MLNEFARKQLHFIIQKYGQLIVDDARRCKGLLKDLAPKHQRETNLIMLVQEHKLVNELLQESQLPVSIKLDRLAQKLHDNVGIQKDFAHWAIESWAIALKISPSEYQDLVLDKHDDFHKDNIPERLFELGERFYNGYGVEKDDIEAFKYYRLAADKGYADAQHKLGWMCFYGLGRGIAESVEGIAESVSWYTLAAVQGHAEAQKELCDLCRKGKPSAYKNIDVIKWVKLAAFQGHVDAQYTLGWLLDFGWGVEKNDEMALYWYQLASNQGHSNAHNSFVRLKLTSGRIK